MPDPPPAAASSLESVLSFVRSRTGLKLSLDREPEAARHVEARMSALGVTDPEGYRLHLERNPAALDDLVDDLLIGETCFLRTPEHFDCLRRRILPELKALRGPAHVISAWSAGCATGEEAYSLALVLEEEGFGFNYRVLGTDLSRRALEFAREASYRPWSLRDVDPATVARHFEPDEDAKHFIVAERHRQRVTFDCLNLAGTGYRSASAVPQGLDVIVCRRVLIYLQREVAKRVVDRLMRALAPGGWLILGAADAPPLAHPDLDAVLTSAGLLYRRRAVRQDRSERDAWHRAPRESPSALEPDAGPPIRANRPGVGSRRREPRRSPDGGHVRRAGGEPPSAPQRPGARAAAPRRISANPGESLLRIQALANVDLAAALEACARATDRHPLSADLQQLLAVLRLALGQHDGALRAARRVIYLEPGRAAGHLVLAAVASQLDDTRLAARAYRTARALCEAAPALESSETHPIAGLEESLRLVEPLWQPLRADAEQPRKEGS